MKYIFFLLMVYGQLSAMFGYHGHVRYFPLAYPALYAKYYTNVVHKSDKDKAKRDSQNRNGSAQEFEMSELKRKAESQKNKSVQSDGQKKDK